MVLEPIHKRPRLDWLRRSPPGWRHPDDRGRKAAEGWIAMADVPEDVQRWTAERRVALV